ncbi:MAG: hypothetical protein AB7O97_15830 [Planctomycetota bacterium]
MNHSSVDGFENYRRERERLRRLGIGDKRPLSGPANALRELEAVEAREERDRQLSLEMQDFFESATRTAAEIVQKVASSAKVRIDEQLSDEMEEFLLDSITRMQGLITAVLRTNSNSTAEQVIEPLMHNLVGSMLDGFRSAGTAETDKHLGVDPMATDLEDVKREFEAKIPHVVEDELPAVQPTVRVDPFAATPPPELDARPPIEEHLVAEVHEPENPQADAGDAPEPEEPKAVAPEQDLQRFKQALESLVRQGQMTKEEARAALKARKAAHH